MAAPAENPAGAAAAPGAQIAAPMMPAMPAVPVPVPMPVAPRQVNDMAAVFALSDAQDSAAWRSLGRLWGAALGPGLPCTVAPTLGLRCYRMTGGLEALRQLDRPGFLKLVGEDQRVVYAVLVGLTDVSATFQSGGARQVVPLSELAGRWRGDYATLWRPPPGYRNADSVGTGGPLADWLKQKLTIAAVGAPSTPDAGSLAANLANFQLSHGLEPDGRPGPLTLMRVNRLVGIEEPRLTTDR